MALEQEQKIRDDTSPKTAELSPEILLLANTITKNIRVASDEAGKTDRFDKINHENPPFLNIDENSILENFLSNYFRQSKDPTEFRFFRAPLHIVKSMASYIREIFKIEPYDEMKDFMDKYEVKPVTQAQKNQKEEEPDSQAQENQKENEVNNPKNQNQMSTSEEVKTQTQTPTAAYTPKAKYTESQVDWNTLDKFGVSRDILERTGDLQKMLAGGKSDRLYPVKANFGKIMLDTQARLSLKQNNDGTVALSVQGVRKLDFNMYYGHIFTEQQKKNLLETGHMGELAYLSFPRTEGKVPCYISLDPLTKQILAADASKIKIPEVIGGKELTQEQYTDLEAGKRIYLEGYVSPKTGKEYNVNLQVSAENWGLHYEFEKSRLLTLGGVNLTEQQVTDYNDLGKSILVKDMERKNGEKFTKYVTKDCNGNAMYTDYNLQTGEVHIPNVIGGVELDKDEMKMLRNGSEIFLDKYTNYRGEEAPKFVKVDLDSGKILTANKLSDFNEKPVYDIPKEYYGHKFTTDERKVLQESGWVHVTDANGFDGGKFSTHVSFNQQKGHIVSSLEKPESPKKAESQTAAQTAAPDSQKKPETPKSETAKTAQKEAKAQTVKETGKQDKKSGFSKKVKV
jgi:hypothetical protein